jgi:excisionase family DNA binding protein
MTDLAAALAALVDALDDSALDRLAARLAPRIAQLAATADDRAVPAVITVERAAGAIGVSSRAIRAAISRGDLPARKVGNRWLIVGENLALLGTPEGRSATRTDARRARPLSRRTPMADAVAALDGTGVDSPHNVKWPGGAPTPRAVAHGGITP